jgi:transposase
MGSRPQQTDPTEGLVAKPHLGPEPRLTDDDLVRLEKLLLAGAHKAGFPSDLWTCPRVADVIQQRFGVEYHPAHIWKILRRLGWSCQKPERRARERNEIEIEHWRKMEWPRIKKGRRRKAIIVFVAESGFLLQPVNRRTWAPRGKTPIQYAWDRHDRLSVIAALLYRPRSGRLALSFAIHDHNIKAPNFLEFLRELRRETRRPILLVCDRLNVHRSAVRQLQEQGADWLTVEWLPPYAPASFPSRPYGSIPNRRTWPTTCRLFPLSSATAWPNLSTISTSGHPRLHPSFVVPN